MNIERPKSRQPAPPHARRVFEGDIFDVYQWDQVLFDGSTKIFEKLKRDDTVTVAASTGEQKLMLLTDEQPGREPILTFPGGRMDEDEDPLPAAKRELLEETGYESDDWELWKAYQPVTKIDWALYIFIAKNCRKIAEPHLDAGERISMNLVTLDELTSHINEKGFMSEDVKVELLEAKYDPTARAKLEKTLFG